MLRKTVITILQLVIFVGLGIFLIYWKAGQMTPEQKREMYDSMRSAKLIYLLPVFVVGFFSHYFRALRWRLLLEPLDIRPTRVNTWCAVMIGYLVNAILPRFGEVAKCTVLAKYEKVPADKMVGTIVAERAFDLVCLIAVILFAFLAQAGIIGSYATQLFERMGRGSGHGGLITLIVVVVLIVLFAVFYQRIKRTKVGRAIKGIGDGVRTINHLRHRRTFIVYTVAIWLCYLGMVMLGCRAIPATEHLSPLVGLTILAFGAVGMILTPGGFGAYPIIVADLLLLYNVPSPDALAFGWVSWMAQEGVIIILGVLSLILLPIYNRKPHDAIHPAALDTAEDL